MKKHISITIDTDAYELVRRMALEEQRSVSQVFERAVLAKAASRSSGSADDLLPVTRAQFRGTVSRADAYGDRL